MPVVQGCWGRVRVEGSTFWTKSALSVCACQQSSVCASSSTGTRFSSRKHSLQPFPQIRMGERRRFFKTARAKPCLLYSTLPWSSMQGMCAHSYRVFSRVQYCSLVHDDVLTRQMLLSIVVLFPVLLWRYSSLYYAIPRTSQ
jgi:hypothetical protein